MQLKIPIPQPRVRGLPNCHMWSAPLPCLGPSWPGLHRQVGSVDPLHFYNKLMRHCKKNLLTGHLATCPWASNQPDTATWYIAGLYMALFTRGTVLSVAAGFRALMSTSNVHHVLLYPCQLPKWYRVWYETSCWLCSLEGTKLIVMACIHVLIATKTTFHTATVQSRNRVSFSDLLTRPDPTWPDLTWHNIADPVTKRNVLQIFTDYSNAMSAMHDMIILWQESL